MLARDNATGRFAPQTRPFELPTAYPESCHSRQADRGPTLVEIGRRPLDGGRGSALAISRNVQLAGCFCSPVMGAIVANRSGASYAYRDDH